MAKARRRLTDRDKNLQQVPVRIHVNDYRALKKLFIDEKWNVQRFVNACIEMYLSRDPLFLKSIGDWADENSITRNDKGKFDHSTRERNALLDEIANEED